MAPDSNLPQPDWWRLLGCALCLLSAAIMITGLVALGMWLWR